MFWKDRIEKKIREICELCNETQSDMRHVRNCIDNELSGKNYNIQDCIDRINKLQLENNELRAKVEEYRSDADKHYEDIGTISGLQDVIKEYENKLVDYDYSKRKIEILTEETQQLQKSLDLAKSLVESTNERIKASTRQNDALQADLTELRKCFSAVLRGMYDREEIEYAALKTYRGWKFVYNNGQMTEDFSNIGEVSCSWYDGEKLNLSMNN